MGILSGSLTVRRYRVLGDVPEGFRDPYRRALNDHAFRENPGKGKAEIEGWVQVHNLLDLTFDDANAWLYEPYAVFSLRVDKVVLPAKLLSAHLAKDCRQWCEERGQDRCPPAVKAELKERIEEEWLRRALPRVQLVDVCWNLTEGYTVVHSLSEAMNDRVRRRFYQTFGLRLVPWSPMDWLHDSKAVEALIALPPAQLHGEA